MYPRHLYLAVDELLDHGRAVFFHAHHRLPLTRLPRPAGPVHQPPFRSDLPMPDGGGHQIPEGEKRVQIRHPYQAHLLALDGEGHWARGEEGPVEQRAKRMQGGVVRR